MPYSATAPTLTISMKGCAILSKGIACSWIREENKRLINSLMSENSRLRSENSDLRWQVTALKSTVLENNAFSFS